MVLHPRSTFALPFLIAFIVLFVACTGNKSQSGSDTGRSGETHTTAGKGNPATTATAAGLRAAPTAVAAIEFVWATDGAPDALRRPVSLAADRQANVFVLDSGNGRIAKFDSSGKLLTTWGSTGSGDGQFVFQMQGIFRGRPGGLAVDGQGIVYVADLTGRIQKFQSDGTFIETWVAEDSPAGQPAAPSSLAVDAAGNVYLADTRNSLVQKFDSHGKFLGKWGSRGGGDGQFNGLGGLAIDSRGSIYVADDGNHRIEKFDDLGNFLYQWTTGADTRGEFFRTGDVAVDLEDNVYLTDNRDGHRIELFDKFGKLLGQWTGAADGGQLANARGIAVTAQRDIYVADPIAGRIEKFHLP
ncbi:MAG: 6-bladed beta-propeller [Dehalococcoidia bacterium]